MIQDMVKVLLHGQKLGINMRAIGLKVKDMVKVSMSGQMEINMRAIG